MARKILFVDNDHILCRAVAGRFAEYAEDFELIIAGDGFEAVNKLKDQTVSLVILELVLPRMDGISLISHIQQHYPDLQVIIVSAIDKGQVQEIAKRSDAIGFLVKPFLAEDLLSMIRTVLQKEDEGGTMYNASPTIFLQLMEMDAKTCTIRILDNDSTMGGVLYFKEGRLFDARIGKMTGIDAAYMVFSWSDTTIYIRNDCPDIADKIQSDLTPIIMTAVAMRDEEVEAEKDAKTQAATLLAETSLDPSMKAQTSVSKEQMAGITEHYKTVIRKDLANAVEQLSSLGKTCGFGEFRATLLDGPKNTTRVLAPTNPPCEIQLESNDSAAQIIKRLRSQGDTAS
jgi:CheY-like chemotaxis protein